VPTEVQAQDTPVPPPPTPTDTPVPPPPTPTDTPLPPPPATPTDTPLPPPPAPTDTPLPLPPTPTNTPLPPPPAPTETPLPLPPTSTATPVPRPRRPLPTDTLLPPPQRPTEAPPLRVTPVLPPADAPPGQPFIWTAPNSGPAGTPVTLLGQGWPAQSSLSVALTQPVAAGAPQQPPQFIAQGIPVDGAGRFTHAFSIPVGQGWENVSQIIILAMTADQLRSAVTPFYVTQGAPEVVPPSDPGLPVSPWRPMETPVWQLPSGPPGRRIVPMQ
jgi:hypothetical protein